MFTNRIFLAARAFLFMAIALAGCDKSSSSSSSSSSGSGGSASSGPEREARDAVMAEIQKHWAKSADGWTTAVNEGSSFASIQFLRQCKDIAIEEVEPFELSESDKLNGFEWAGEVKFKKAPYREAGEQGVILAGMGPMMIMRRPGAWTQWVDFQPISARVQKQKGKWLVEQDTFMMRGRVPTVADYAKAGVK